MLSVYELEVRLARLEHTNKTNEPIGFTYRVSFSLTQRVCTILNQ